MQTDLESFVRRLTVLRAELLHERKLEARALRQLKSVKGKHADKTLLWKKLLSQQDQLKQNYVVSKKKSIDEQNLLRKAKNNLSVVQKKWKVSGATASREKHESRTLLANFDAMYNKEIHLETIGKQLLQELNRVKATVANNKTASKAQQDNIQNLDSVHSDVTANIAKVQELLSSSVRS